MAKSTNYRGIHISVIYEYGYDYYEIREINKGKKWNDATLFSTLKEAKQYIDDHYDELVKLCNVKESKSYARKSLKEAKNGYYIYTKLDNKYAYCDKSKFTEEGFYLIEDYMLDAIHIFETEKEAEKFIDKDLNRFMVKKDNVVIDEYPSTKGGFFESKESARKSLKEYNYDSHNKSWVSDSVEKVYTNGLESKNDWCALSLYEDEYENLVNYLLDEKGFVLEKKYTKKLGYDVFINEKLDLYVVIMNETTYGFFDEKYFIIRFGDELGIETPSEVVEKTLKGILFETFDLTKNDADLIKSNVDYIILKTKESIDKKLLDNVLNDELSKYHYPISVEVEEGKDESICIIWVS